MPDVEDPRTEHFGRGPETVYTRYAGVDTLISVLTNSLTPVERSVREMGEAERLREIRMMFQHATEDQFRAEVERVTGRTVIAFMSGVDVRNHVCCEVFTLQSLSRLTAPT